jgi:hypothetical protein
MREPDLAHEISEPLVLRFSLGPRLLVTPEHGSAQRGLETIQSGQDLAGARTVILARDADCFLDEAIARARS